ncbi:Cruciform DNA binding protein [Diatrype stigma]|uniref:Cruciform DNA binding protein n=1 Tax=Diatrype stigma TaxID=117547 RepID=A0AAN9UVK3_9PEZI
MSITRHLQFVVDGNWVTDPTAPKEADEGGNENNVLEPAQITTEPTAATAMLSSAAPESTTAALAAEVPLEKKDAAATETPAADAVVGKSEKDEEDKKDEKDENSSDLPGTFPVTPAAELGINPLPAAAGAVNPVTLAPGEAIPEEVSAESTTANVKLDAESYEKSDALPGISHDSPPLVHITDDI